MLRLPGQHLSFLVGFPFCILICTYSVLGSWQYFSVAAETAAAHTHTRKMAKKKKTKKNWENQQIASGICVETFM